MAPQVTSRKYVKFGRVVFEICERTDTQSDKQTDRLSYKYADHNTSGAKSRHLVLWCP